MRVVVVENDNADGADRVRVHRDGCQDVARDSQYAHTYVTTMDAGGRLDVVSEVFAAEMSEEDNPADWLGEVTFLPCCKLK